QRRILRLFQRRELLDAATVENMLTWQGSGGFSLDASVRIHGTDRAGRERLLRYCARPPLALERMSLEQGSGSGAAGGGRSGPEQGDAGRGEAGPGAPGPIRRVLYLPPRPLLDGRSVLALSPLEFLAALARLIPPPRVHRHRYDGVLAPNARLRSRVVALARAHTAALAIEECASDLNGPTTEETAGTVGTTAAATGPPDWAAPADPARSAARSRWACLIARIYEVSPLRCPGTSWTSSAPTSRSCWACGPGSSAPGPLSDAAAPPIPNGSGWSWRICGSGRSGGT
ncbi:MAG TPA: transposase, partial [Longimicrobiales bacterium]|nr:transposase [Longimicrobiales bacterium]